MRTGILAAMVLAVTVALGACAQAQRQEPTADAHAALVARGETLFRVQGCYGCHLVGKFGTPIGPDLSHIGAKYSEPYITRWLQDPELQRPTAHMPKLELTPGEVQALAAYMASLG